MEAGIKAILDLQAVAGVAETIEDATIAWKRMNAVARASTITAHRKICGPDGINYEEAFRKSLIRANSLEDEVERLNELLGESHV